MTAAPPAVKRVTSFDVAREAGVSRSTVSQILNGDGRFPEETRSRVRAAADALGYRPSRAGRALVTGLSDVVVIVVPNTTFGPHLQDSIDRITRAPETAGLSVVVRFGNLDDEATLVSVLDLRPTAVFNLGIFSGAQRTRLLAAGVRVVPETSAAGSGLDLDPVDELIGRLQVRELTREVPRAIVYAGLGDRRLDPYGPPREHGVRAEAAERGLGDVSAVRVPLELSAATDVVNDVLERADGRGVGFCCYNDDVAIAIVAAARELGRTVPDDVAVVGVDRTAIGQLVSPRLSTVYIDLPVFIDAMLAQLGALRGRPAASSTAAEQQPDPDSLVRVVRGETS
jgi:DNA-binding LacI/PurR family transcriptional regulator